jgi:hypothetical protein
VGGCPVFDEALIGQFGLLGELAFCSGALFDGEGAGAVPVAVRLSGSS